MKEITIALAKGRLADDSIKLLEKSGIDCSAIDAQGRRLIFRDEINSMRFLLAKPSDVPTYVEYGTADMGIVGRDTLMEASLPLYEMLDTGLGKCSLCIAGYPEQKNRPVTSSHLRVATKYPNIARKYYEALGESIEIIKLNGSVEMGPLLGISDVILDIVESGNTLRANGLVVLEKICDISAMLVVNRVSLKTKRDRIMAILNAVRRAVSENTED